MEEKHGRLVILLLMMLPNVWLFNFLMEVLCLICGTTEIEETKRLMEDVFVLLKI